jgi:DNA-binding CsgD family transcriptional regulator
LKATLIANARELRAATEAGRDLRDERGRRRRALGPASIRSALQILAAILDEAVEDELLESNPARNKRMRVRVPKPSRTFLEMDELAALLQAAGAQDEPVREGAPHPRLSAKTLQVERLVSKGYPPRQLAKRLGMAPGTVSFHLRRLGVRVGHGYCGRRVMVEILGRSGVRVGELCDLRIGQLRLRGSDGGRFQILDSKTETGIRRGADDRGAHHGLLAERYVLETRGDLWPIPRVGVKRWSLKRTLPRYTLGVLVRV